MSSLSPTDEAKKYQGKVYTPSAIVNLILDLVGYKSTSSSSLLKRTIIDPACGDGAFLVEIVKRYLTYAQNQIYAAPADFFLPPSMLKTMLIEAVYGLDINKTAVLTARENMARTANAIMPELQMQPADFSHVIEGNTLALMATPDSALTYQQQFDFVVGNPPYVRIHNLAQEKVLLPSWCQQGMTDLYYAFFQWGLAMLKEATVKTNAGTLGYIAPSSWFTASAALPMRQALQVAGSVATIVDLEHTQVFPEAQTYTAIVILKPQRQITISYQTYTTLNQNRDQNQESIFNKMPYEEAWFGSYFMPLPAAYRSSIKAIVEWSPTTNTSSIQVKNGFATNWDAFFIRSSFPSHFAPAPYLIPVVKASTGEEKTCFFPYDYLRYPEASFSSLQEALTPLDVFSSYEVYQDLQTNKEQLLRRNQVDENNWYGFARSQGIKDLNQDKVAVNLLYRDVTDIKITPAPAGTGVYGGIYVLGLSSKELHRALTHPVYMVYVKALRKYKSHGYYTLSGKDLVKYLQWWQETQS